MDHPRDFAVELRQHMDTEYRSLVAKLCDELEKVDMQEACTTMALIGRSPEELGRDCERLLRRRLAADGLKRSAKESANVEKLKEALSLTKSVTADAEEQVRKLENAFIPDAQRGPSEVDLREAQRLAAAAREQSNAAHEGWREAHQALRELEREALTYLANTGIGTQEERLDPSNFAFC